MFEVSTFKSLKYYASNFWWGVWWTRGVARLLYVKSKNIIASLPTKPTEVWSKNSHISQRSKSRTYSESKFV